MLGSPSGHRRGVCNGAHGPAAAYMENMSMCLDRYGFLEETCVTFSFSPITDESGPVGAVISSSH